MPRKPLPPPEYATHQYGVKTDWYSKKQMLEYAQSWVDAADVFVAKESLPLRQELVSDKEQEATME